MNNLPEPILDNIYKYKHQLEFKHVMDQLIDNIDIDTICLHRRRFIKYLKDNIHKIECVILSHGRKMCVRDYLKLICKDRNRVVYVNGGLEGIVNCKKEYIYPRNTFN